MAVNLSDAEIRQFELAGITKEDIGKTIERDRAAGLSDQDIELNAAVKAANLEKANPSFTQGRGVSRWISNLPFGDTINRGIQGAKAVYDATLDYVTGNNKPTIRQYLEAPEGVTLKDRSWSDLVSENYTENMNKLERTFKEQNYDVPKWYRWPMDAAGTIGSYGLLPEGIYETVPRAAAFGAADAYQAGINKDSRDRIVNALIGGVTSGAVTGVMNKVTGASAMKKAEKEYPLLAEGFKKNPPKTTEEAVDRITDNFVKNSLKTSMKGRVEEEATKLFGNMDTATLKSIADSPSGKAFESPMGKAITKRITEAMKVKKPETKAKPITDSLSKLVNTSAAAKPSTEGLTGGILGALGGGWIGGPVGSIAGALLGSKGKIGNALSGVGEILLGKSGQRLTKAIVNPQGTNAVARALRKVATPEVTGLVKKAVVPVVQNSLEEDKTSYLPSRQYKKTTTQVPNRNPNTIPLNLPGTTIVLPDNDNSESITQKHLQLLAALYPQYYQRAA